MNKTTTLVLAAIAGFGLCAQARTTSTNLWDVDFDDVIIAEATIPLSSATNAIPGGTWTIAEDDESCVTNGVGLGGSLSNLLELNTQGNELKWKPANEGTVGNRSIVETDIRFVGADDAPEGFDAGNTAQTAFYLKNLYEDEEPSGYEFFAWAYDMDGGTNKWVSLLTTNDVSFADGWHKLQVVIDYREANPYLHVALDGVEVTNPASPPVAANADTTKTTGRMTAVTFKGTGSIDNFTGTRLNTDFAKYDFTAEIYKDGELESTSVDPNREAGDYDDDTFAARFTSIPYHDWDEESVTWALSSVVIVDLSTGAETTYDYTYDKVNHIIASANPCPVLSLDFETFEYNEQIFTNYTGTFSLAPLTYGATSNSVIAKVNYRTLDAYYANEVITVGETTVVNPTFVKPSDCPKAFTNVYPAATNVNETAYVLSSVKVAGGATVAFANDQATVSFSVADQLPADTTYVEATYVAGTYNADAVDWGYNETTGKYEFQTKTFTVTWVVDGVSTPVADVAYGTPTSSIQPADPVKTDFNFTGWDPAPAATVTADATYTATFVRNATVIVITDNGDDTTSTNGYNALATAIAEAPAGATVVLLDDAGLDATVTIAKNLTLDLNDFDVTATNCRAFHVSAGTVAFTGAGTISSVTNAALNAAAFQDSSSVIRVGSNAAATVFTLGEDVVVETDYCYGITYFGTQPQTVTVNGTVAVTGSQPALSGNGTSTLAETTLVVGQTAVISAANDYAIYNPQAGTTLIDGTVTGLGGIEVKAGEVTIGEHAVITATGTPSYSQSNQDGTSTSGYAIASVGNSAYKQPAAAVVQDGASVTGTVVVLEENGSTTYGEITSYTELTAPEGYAWVEDGGDVTLVKTWVVTYANYDGTVLQVTTNATGTATPGYAGTTPVKPSAGGYDYTFTGWDPAVVSTVTADATYTAQFSGTQTGTIMVISANGAVTNLSETLAAAVAAVEDGGKIVLTDDQNAGASRIQVSNKSFTVDLNGQTLSSSEADNIIFRVSGGQTIQIEGTTPGSTFVGSVMIAGSTEGHIAVNGGTYTNDLYCPFYANGTCSAASSIAITNATIVAVDAEAGQPGADSETGFGLYVAGPAATTLKDTTIVADKTGVEIRAGSLVVDGGSITAGDTFSTAANGNGGTVYGAAISVSPHNTNKPIAVEVNGGTFTAAKAVYENYLQPQARTAETAVTLNGGSFIGEVDIVEDIGTVIPSTSTALFSDSDADGVPAGYRLVADGETGLYKVVEIVPYLELMTDTMYINCTNFARVVDAPAGSTYRFKLTPDSVAGYNRSSNWDMAKPYGKAPGTATLTYYVTNNNEQVALFSTNITVKDVYAVVDGVEYSSAQWTNAVAAALENDKVLEIYKAKASVALAAGQSLRWKYIGTKSNGSGSSVNCTVPAATSSAVYAVTKTTDPLTGVTTSACTSSAPSVMITKADGSVTYANEFNFETANSTNKVLRSFSSGRQTVNVLNATLDLNGCTVTFAETDYVAITVGSSSWKTGSLTIKDTSVAGTGKIVSASDGIDVAYNASSVTIEGGAIEAVTSAVYLMNANASATISGGSFKVTSGEATYLLNMLDSARGTITVTGGSFYGFDPMNNTAEGAGTDFVDPAYATLADSPSSGWYTVVPAYTVTWKDDDGTTLEADTRVPAGATPSFDGETPTKASTAQYDYAFDAWTPAVEAVSSNAVYNATYTETLRSYTITWVNYDGTTVLDTDEVAYGETPEYAGETPVKPNDGDTEFEFDGWSPAIVAVTGEATYTATFKEKAGDDHIGAKSDDGFVILAPADGDYDTTKPLTFAAPDLTAGTVDISASMIWPDGVTSTTLTLVYKKSLLGPEFTAQVTVAKTGEDSATVTMPDFSGEDTIFFIGFRNEAGVED